jgi:hypothetical protein
MVTNYILYQSVQCDALSVKQVNAALHKLKGEMHSEKGWSNLTTRATRFICQLTTEYFLKGGTYIDNEHKKIITTIKIHI